MQILIVNLAGTRYGIPTSEVIEIVPRIALRPLPQAPDFIAGVFSYRGSVVPAVDLQMLTYQKPCALLLSTRIILFNLKSPGHPDRVLGLIAEHVTEIALHHAGETQPTGVTVENAPYLGEIALERSGETLQLLQLDKILPQALHEILFSEEKKA